MKYIKIRADFKYAEKGRLYRVFLVPKSIGLYELGCHIVSVFHGTLEHCFLYTQGKTEFVQAPFMEDIFPGINSLWMGLYDIADLPDSFEFRYDTGDGWDFKCKKYKKIVEAEYEGDPRIIVLEGAGQGIWEDNISTLYAYFEGRLDPNAEAKEFEDEEGTFYLPWNVSIDKWGDYDAPLDETLFDSMEDPAWEESWKRELEYAKELGLDKVQKEKDPFRLRRDISTVQDDFMRMFGQILPFAYGREDIIGKAKALYGDKIGESRYDAAFKEEIGKVLTPEAIEALFQAIEKKLEK